MLIFKLPADARANDESDESSGLRVSVRQPLARAPSSSASQPLLPDAAGEAYAYTKAEGLAHDVVRQIHLASDGRIWLGTSRSVDRLDLATDRIKRYTIADGLAANESQVAYRDRQGTLWFGTWNGISRLVPEPERPASPPPVMIDGLQIAGVRHPVSDLGETEIGNLRLSHTQNQVQIDFLGLGFGAGELVRATSTSASARPTPKRTSASAQTSAARSI